MAELADLIPQWTETRKTVDDLFRAGGDEQCAAGVRAALDGFGATAAAEIERLAGRDGESLAWNLALHEEKVLNERGGLFLVAHAMLLVSYATLLPHANGYHLLILAAVGVVMAIGWLRLNRRQVLDLEAATKSLRDSSAFYRTYQATRGTKYRGADRLVLVLGLPWAVGLVWVALLVERITTRWPSLLP